MNTASSFSFKGRYTLREINGTWYIYDRDIQTVTINAGNTFKAAEQFLNDFVKVNA
jgi:hypothetical protein